MKTFWAVFLVLLFLHQDLWNWAMEEIIYFGMPRGLLYHAFFSLACSCLGAWAVFRAWPEEWEKYAEQISAESENVEQGSSMSSSE
jgi:hypothetical protein